ncbi:MAG TPA: HEAT repeat domain-containing protein [Reyranella sp.]|jgi:HEAT repeat protein|nr:HEAT repeat domain-containing protein [Reyranella sp.]
MVAATGSYDSLLAELAIPHRAKTAYRALLKAGPAAMPAMRRGLKHVSADVRYWCCQYLDRFLEPEVVGELVTMLDDVDARVRLTTLHTLACDRCKVGDCRPEEAEILPRAIGLLTSDPDRHVRAMALEVVGRFVHGSDQAAAAIAAAGTGDSSPAVRKKAKWYAPGGAIYRRTAP